MKYSSLLQFTSRMSPVQIFVKNRRQRRKTSEKKSKTRLFPDIFVYLYGPSAKTGSIRAPPKSPGTVDGIREFIPPTSPLIPRERSETRQVANRRTSDDAAIPRVQSSGGCFACAVRAKRLILRAVSRSAPSCTAPEFGARFRNGT